MEFGNAFREVEIEIGLKLDTFPCQELTINVDNKADNTEHPPIFMVAFIYKKDSKQYEECQIN